MTTSRFDCRLTALALSLGLLASGWPAVATGDPSPARSGQEQEEETRKEKKRKKKRKGKTVTATFVETEWPASSAAESDDEASGVEPAAPSGSAAPHPPARDPGPESERRTAPSPTDPPPGDSPPPRSAPSGQRAEAEPAPDRPRAEAPTPGPPPPARRAQRRPSREPADVFGEEIVVSEVLLDVLVTDKQGGQVPGLGPADFVIEENGVERPVTSVTYYGGPGELGASGPSRTDRYFILLFHDQKQTVPQLTAAQLDAGRWTRRWIEQEMQRNDQVAVLGYDVKLKIYQDFTRDEGAILEAIDKAARGGRAPEHWKRASGPELDPDSPTLLANLPTGAELSRQTRKLQQALGLVGRAAEGIVGRKNLLLFSIGFGDIHEFGLYTPDRRYYPDMMESLNAGNVAVYSIDMLGALRSSPGSRLLNDSLSSISGDTGGHYYSNFTNVLTPVREISEDNLGYYLLSFRTEYDSGDAGYRSVKVRMADKSLRVRARKGYRYGQATLGSR